MYDIVFTLLFSICLDSGAEWNLKVTSLNVLI